MRSRERAGSNTGLRKDAPTRGVGSASRCGTGSTHKARSSLLLLSFFRRRGLILLLAGVVGALTGFLLAQTKETQYSASATLLVFNVLEGLRARRIRAHQKRLWDTWGVSQANREFVRRHGLTVRGGPFAGMHYPEEVAWETDALIPKLLGSYERELHDLEFRGPTFVDVGCAEGYYAVGVALTTGATVNAHDLDPVARRLCERLAEQNRVGGLVTVGGKIKKPYGDFLFADCEGFEAELFENGFEGTALVELHDCDVSRRFPLHRERRFRFQPRDPADYPELDFVDSELAERVLSEHRPLGQQWALYEPR